MTASPASDVTLFWNDSLAEELLRFLSGRLKCQETAADLTQETFLRFQQYVKDCPPDNARALAYRIAVNLATDYQRKIKLRNSLTVALDSEVSLDHFASAAPGPEQIVSANQRLLQLNAALDGLSAICRTVFLLHGLEGLTYAQIAARLGISESMVYKHLSKAMAHCAMQVDDVE
jgi:RNA polymerase sigma factor (sigma-70 family)